MTRKMRILLAVFALFLCGPVVAAEIRLEDDKQGVLQILLGEQHVADYVYQDAQIYRPYFKSVHVPDGSQLTRNQPPDPNLDVPDHPLFHPGIWLSFGDLNGSDYWRLAAKVKFIGFDDSQAPGDDGKFAARFQYLDQLDPRQVNCEELFTCQIVDHPTGILILWDSTFTSPNEFYFGDQEEMGLGIRMATALRSEAQARGPIPPGTGTILDAEGRKNGAEVWGHAAAWCDYSGTVDGHQIGATLLCHPENFRPSWFHAREYGLLVANPFGRTAFKQGEPSRVVVKSGEQFRLRYGILLHAGQPDFNSIYKDYVELTSDK